jgi:hypothetical protein
MDLPFPAFWSISSTEMLRQIQTTRAGSTGIEAGGDPHAAAHIGLEQEAPLRSEEGSPKVLQTVVRS